ncbi:MAG: MarR family transcriptional regulator [Oliverpabstia sp.]|nr:MarR family transcriptional regulator [Oliverpabstia sp.]
MMCERENSVQHLMFLTTHAYLAKSFRQVSSQGIHPGQIPILKLLQREEGIRQSEISKKLGVQPPTVTVSVKRMEKMGLIYRKVDEKDQRMQRVYLTQKGSETVNDVKENMKNNEKIMLDGMSETEICLLKRFLQQMYENIQKFPQEEKRTEKEEKEIRKCSECFEN